MPTEAPTQAERVMPAGSDRVGLSAELAARPVATAAAQVLDAELERLLAQEQAVREGTDPEAVHKMRVASRRFRTAIRVFRPWLRQEMGRERLDALDGDIRALAQALGRVRDEDVLAARLREGLAAGDEPAIEQLIAARAECRAAARAELMGMLGGPLLTGVRGQLRAELDLLLATAPRRGAPRAAVGRVGPKLIARRMRSLRRGVLEAPTRDALHRTRIRAKRLRYAGEFLEHAFGPAARGTIDDARAIQDALGAVTDADLAIDTLLREIECGRMPESSAPLARLIRGCRADREAQLARFGELARALPRPRDLQARLKAETAP